MADLNEFIDKPSDSEEVVDTFRLIDIDSHPVKDVFSILLQDKTTKKNIIWATDAYAKYGKSCSDSSHLAPELFYAGRHIPLQPRIEKATEAQQDRTRSKGEVFTPVWICNRMINWEDQEWFGRPNVFNHENEDGSWTNSEGPIEFPEGKTWKDYVDSRRLEITCGEAPFLVSRYNAATGEFIEPPIIRVGILDRKLRIVTENCENIEDWTKWAVRSVQSCYGYEYQGDNLLIARINVLMTFYEHYVWKWSTDPSTELLRTVANIISWNLWQMDGFKDVVPFGKPYEQHVQMTLFDSFLPKQESEEDIALPSMIYNWRRDNSQKFKECKSRGKMKKKLFDFVIGNPPYQEEFSNEGNKTYAAPVYNTFMDAAFEVGEAVELIHPARFLFNAGSTPKAWNNKMLNDTHFKVLFYEEDPRKIFPTAEIKGGVAITYRDGSQEYGAIQIFTKYPELNTILKKTKESSTSITSIIHIQNRFDLSTLLGEHPEFRSGIGSDGKDSRFEKNIFTKIPLFVSEPIHNSIKTLGIQDNKRVFKYIEEKYVDSNHENLQYYKVVIPVANGNGKFGEPLGTLVILGPQEAYTRSFIGIGSFDNKIQAEAARSYLKCKFTRAMLSVLKVTQMANKDVWEHVPIQDFSENSDIDWSKPVPEIDRQLYRKYKLSAEEIEFIETNVQEMS
ncbi:Eco57I restriction-modification methylase domain-containing protein [Methanomethylophilus alvi]|uniref:Eco57I restriction-modification methylase domain-containing protein n=1 Tax=Methanomethylophilus alvi TaxID=1291540 RepID=UPI0037DD7F2B